MVRSDGRSFDQLRPIRIIPNCSKHALGSALIEMGDTRVLCTVSVDDNIPPFLRNSQPAQGWLTAEYSMLPGATSPRSKRERSGASGRTQEIQRLIGRSLRGIIDLKLCLEKTFHIDCDVLQADGGTRTAAINGAYVALQIAVNNMLRNGKLKVNPITDSLTAVSIGLKEGKFYVDLSYEEDSNIDLDMNIVMTGSGKILEIQGTAERASFSKDEVIQIMDTASLVLAPITELQTTAIEGCVAEG